MKPDVAAPDEITLDVAALDVTAPDITAPYDTVLTSVKKDVTPHITGIYPFS